MDHRKSQVLCLFIPLLEGLEREFKERTGVPTWQNRWPGQEPRIQRLHERLLKKAHKAFSKACEL